MFKLAPADTLHKECMLQMGFFHTFVLHSEVFKSFAVVFNKTTIDLDNC